MFKQEDVVSFLPVLLIRVLTAPQIFDFKSKSSINQCLHKEFFSGPQDLSGDTTTR
jgi:hypothetical protein